MDVMLGYCFVHTCKGLVELAISLLSIDHGCHVGILLCAYMWMSRDMVEGLELAISLLSIDHGCHVGILLCAYM